MSAHDLRGAVLAFHETYGHPVRQQPTLEVPQDEMDLAIELIAEEFGELVQAVTTEDLIETADALGDLLWVVESMAIRLGINTDRVLHEITESNRSKLGSDGKPVLRSDGKILKGPNYVEPNIARALDPEHVYDHERELDLERDIVMAPSGAVAQRYLPVEYPNLANLRVVTPLQVDRLRTMPFRDVYVMQGIRTHERWDYWFDIISAAQTSTGGRTFLLEC